MIALAYPFIILILLIGFAFAVYKKHFLVGVIVIAVCSFLNYYAKVFAINFLVSSNCGELKVMIFNINASRMPTDKDVDILFNLIVSQDADMLFLAEDFEPLGKKLTIV